MSAAPGDDLEADRERLLGGPLARLELRDSRIIEAFRRVPRERFLPEAVKAQAYDDRALPLAEGQTVSQPSMIAIMLDALACRSTDRVLEIGAGSGYAAALLGCLAAEVHAVEIRPALAERARATLAALAHQNVHVHVGDGARGLPEHAPFDRILVSAAARDVPAPLVDQLAPGGRLVIPVGPSSGQLLQVGVKLQNGAVRWSSGTPCVFVPLVGAS